jgi:4-amino-4-deoxy-L-arabinose transferase-like glycosyltransferase
LTNPFRIPGWILLLAFCFFFFLWKLSSFGLIGADEPRYAQVAREMLERRDWVTPTLGGMPWLEKPPLYYWQAMIAYRVFGVSDWAARLPSVLDASVLVFAIFCFVRRVRPDGPGDPAVMLACSAGMIGYARAASMDMPLAATFAIAMIAWYRWFQSESFVYLAMFYASLAFALLAKGPVALLLAAVIIFVFGAVRRDLRIAWRTLRLPGIVLFCMVGLPWYMLVQLRNPQFFRIFILEHNLARFGTNMFHHPEPFWYYVPVTLLGWVPWTIFVIAALLLAIDGWRKRDTDPLNPLLLIWIVVILIFFSISQSKLPGYVLPAIPGGVLLLGAYLRAKADQKPHAVLIVLHAGAGALLIFGALLVKYVIFQHGLEWNRSMVFPLAFSVAIGVGMAVVLFKMGFSAMRVVTIVPAVIALALTLRLGAPALEETLSARSVSQALSRVAPRQLPVAVVMVSRETEFGLQFYRNQKIPRYELGQAPSGEHLLVAAQGFRKAFQGNVPERRIVYLGSFPAQRLEFFYVGP